jgi:outer membrane protein assembly factor BamB
VADNGTLFVVDEMNTTTAIDTVDGSVAWQFVNAESDALPVGPGTIAVYGDGLPVASDTTVVTLTTGGDVIAIDRESGEELWRKSGFHGVASHLALAEDVLVVLSAEWWDGKDATPVASPETTTRPAVVNGAYGLSLSDGTTLWEQHLAGPVHKPAVSGTTVAFIGVPSGLDEDGPETTQLEYEVSRNVTAINVETGVVVWTTPAGANLFMEIESWTSEDDQSSLFVAGSSDGVKFWSLTGEEKHSGAGAQEYFINDLVTGNGVLVAMLADGTLIGINPDPLASL